jgi:predicted transcriptional regulator
MQALWKIRKGFVKDLLPHFSEPRPAYNTVSTIVRILEKKGFIDHKAYGKTHEYFPLISKKDYTKSYMKSFTNDYFKGSFRQMVSFFAREKEISLSDIESIKEMIIKENKSKENDNG